MPHYYFDIKDGHRLVDPSGLDLKNDGDAIAKASVIAVGVSLDKPAVDPERQIAVLMTQGRKSSGCRFIPSRQLAPSRCSQGRMHSRHRRSKWLRFGSSIPTEGRSCPLPSSVDKRPLIVLMTSAIY